MKTITLDEVAYHHLKAWKINPAETFSSVIKRVLPERGSLGAFMSFIERKRTDLLPANQILKQAIDEQSSEKCNPWD